MANDLINIILNGGIINYSYEKKFDLKIKDGKIIRVAFMQYVLYYILFCWL